MKKAYFEKIDCQFVKDVFKQEGYKQVDDMTEADILWTKNQNPAYFAKHLNTTINQIPNILEIDRKDRLFDQLNTYFNANKHQKPFYPETFVLRQDLEKLKQTMAINSNNDYFILKQSLSACGRSIQIFKNIEDAEDLINDSVCVCQRYIQDIYLFNERKFDFRLYCLIFKNKLYSHKNYLIRVCGEPWQVATELNKANKHIHLSNTTINKNKYSNHEFFKEFSAFSEQCLLLQFDNMMKTVFDVVYTNNIHQRMEKIGLESNMQKGKIFCLLGVDVIMSTSNELQLLEVNQSPSLVNECEADAAVKGEILRDLINLLDSGVSGGFREIASHKNRNEF